MIECKERDTRQPDFFPWYRGVDAPPESALEHGWWSTSMIFTAKIMLKLFILMSSTSFSDYLISGAHCINFSQIGRKTDRPPLGWPASS
jgi:hypothetical protein